MTMWQRLVCAARGHRWHVLKVPTIRAFLGFDTLGDTAVHVRVCLRCGRHNRITPMQATVLAEMLRVRALTRS